MYICGSKCMNGARGIYKEILKELKYQKRLDEINKIENNKNRKESISQLDKEINADVNDNEYRKIDSYIKATYKSLGVKAKLINEIEDEKVYIKLQNDLIELCKRVSYDKFYAWMIMDWKDYYKIKEKDTNELIKKIRYYIELKSIVMSVIEVTEEETIRNARKKYNNAVDMYKLMLKDIETIVQIETINSGKSNNRDGNYDVEKEAKNLLEKYKNIIKNINNFNDGNYYVKSKEDDMITVKRIERFFLINKFIISVDIYNEYKELREQYIDLYDNIKKTKKEEKYKLYEMIIMSDNPNIEKFVADELDLLQRCRCEYKKNPDIDIRECIVSHERAIEEEKMLCYENEFKEYDW